MHSTGLIPIDGHDNLYRDPKTNAIIVKDDDQYTSYIKNRNKIAEKNALIDQTAQEVKELKSEISEIKQLLLKLTSDINT